MKLGTSTHGRFSASDLIYPRAPLGVPWRLGGGAVLHLDVAFSVGMIVRVINNKYYIVRQLRVCCRESLLLQMLECEDFYMLFYFLSTTNAQRDTNWKEEKKSRKLHRKRGPFSESLSWDVV